MLSATGGITCAWPGLACDTLNNHVNGLLMTNKGSWGGTIPESLASLSFLTFLQLGNMKLRGTVPAALFELPLVELNLFDNSLSGDVVSRVPGTMMHLDLSGNSFTGSLSPFLFEATNLTFLKLDDNEITGTIPDNIGLSVNLRTLILGGNFLSGVIPTSLVDLIQLKYLDLSSNMLYDNVIPTFIGQLYQLLQLDLSKNNLNGPIPESIFYLTQLQYLFLGKNHLSGTIPESIGQLSSLAFLDLSNNDLSGTIPTSFWSLSYLTSLWMNCNHLEGSIPSQISSLTNLQNLFLYQNNISGVAEEIFYLDSLRNIDISENSLTGTTPSIIGQNLTSLSLRGNLLNGSISNLSSISGTIKLYELDYSSNQLTGTIPIFLSLMPTLKGLYLDFNNLSGDIVNIFSSFYLSYISVMHNSLTGSLPEKLMANVVDINIASNQFTGTIPTMLFDYCVNLSSFQIQDNHFNGTIPQLNLNFLTRLKLAANDFTGTIPKVLNLPSLTELDLSFIPFEQDTIPSQIGDLTSLISLALYSNNFKAISPNFSQLSNLVNLDLADNQLNNISVIGTLTNLQTLDLSYNKLVSISVLKNLVNLKELYLKDMQLTGSIPTELFLLTQLTLLDLSYNYFNGTIPTQLGYLSALKYLDFSNNSLCNGCWQFSQDSCQLSNQFISSCLCSCSTNNCPTPTNCPVANITVPSPNEHPSTPSPLPVPGACFNPDLQLLGYCDNMIWILNSTKINNQKTLVVSNTQVIIDGNISQVDLSFTSSTVSIKGDYVGKDSNISLVNSLLFIQNNLKLNNGTISLTFSSSINVNGDVDLSNSNLLVDLNLFQNNQNVELIHSNSSNPIFLPHISLLNAPQDMCTSVTYKVAIQSVVLSSHECPTNSITLIASIVGGILGSICIILVVVYIIRRNSQYDKSFKNLQVQPAF
uniref:Disease resistance R13L4/SHOC-2-like LRR domain-containing protein n=1 Tax=Arcella intermedia TaxID=1963864 RepID=A0A6B2KX93_9EUKA